MVESTARRERGGEPTSAPLATYLWEVPQKPVAVRLAFDFIDRLEREVIENFRSLTSQGSEIGGVLLGSVVPGSPLTVIVQDFEQVPCDYSRGPLYRLADADLARIEKVIEQRSAPGGMPVVGFFRGHSRKGLNLDSDDVAFLDARLRSPHHIALLVRPFATKTSVGGIFIREDGAMKADASYLEFPFRSSQLTSSLWTPPEPAPAPAPVATPVAAAASAPPVAKPGIRPQVVPIGLRRDAAVAAPPAEVKPAAPPVERIERKVAESKPVVTAAEVKPVAPVRPVVPEPRPVAKEVKPAPVVAKAAVPVEEPKPAPVVKPVEKPPEKPVVEKAAPAKPVAEKPVPAKPVAEKPAPAKPVVEKPVFGAFKEPEPAASKGSGKWVLVVVCIALLLSAGVALFYYPGFLRPHPAPVATTAGAELALRVEPSGTDLLLTWNKNSSTISTSSHGVLSINDGDRHENYDMDAKQLKTGSIVYTPVTGDVSFDMEVMGPNQTKPVTESVRSLRTRPSPMPEGKATTAIPAAGKPNQPAAAGTETAANTTPAEAVPATPAKPAPKVFNTASLVDRLRPASPDEIASLDAAPASPAGVNVGSSLNVPFGSAAPAPVAPAQPVAAKKAPVSGGKVAPAQLVYHRDPDYPTAARQLGAHGQVVLEATIGRDGRVIAVKVISGHPLLAQAAKAAVMQWRYRPTLLDGQPVENTTQISLDFKSAH